MGSSPTADILVSAPGVVGSHARLTERDVEAIAECLVGSVPLAPGAKRIAIAGTTLAAGTARFVLEDEDDGDEALATRDLAFKALARGASAPDTATVIVAEGRAAGKRLALREARSYSVGRADACDLVVDDQSMSRVHFEVEVTGTQVLARDRDATGGTFLGSARLAPGVRAVWPPGVMLRAGRVVFALAVPREWPSDTKDGAAETRAVPTAAPASTESVPSLRMGPGGTSASVAEVPVAEPVAAIQPAGRSALIVGLLALVIGGSIAMLIYLLVV